MNLTIFAKQIPLKMYELESVLLLAKKNNINYQKNVHSEHTYTNLSQIWLLFSNFCAEIINFHEMAQQLY